MPVDAESQGSERPSAFDVAMHVASTVNLRALVLVPSVPVWLDDVPSVFKSLLFVAVLWIVFEIAWTFHVSEGRKRRRIRADGRSRRQE